VSVFTKEHIELLRQYFLSDNPGMNQILDSFPVELRGKVLYIHNEFEKNKGAKSIAIQINAQKFEKELEEIQSTYYLNQLGLSNQEFEQELLAAIKPIERENLKKKLIAFEEMGVEDLSDIELKSAITFVERKALKKKLQSLENSSEEKILPYEPELRPAAKLGAIPLQSILKYAVAACVVFAIGIGVYQFTRQDVIPENTQAYSSEEKSTDQPPKAVQEIETIPLDEVSIKSNSLVVIKSGLGFAESEEKITLVEHDQKERILSVQNGISEYERRMVLSTNESENQDIDQLNLELRNRILSLQEELQLLNQREDQYLFDGKKLILYGSFTGEKSQIISLDANYYLKKEGKFFKLSIAKEPQLLQEETDPNVQKALDKILFDAE
jgi:hypothetical protein